MKIGIIAPYDVFSMAEGASTRVFELAKGLNSCGALVYVLHHGSARSLSSNFKFINFKSCSYLVGSENYLHPFNLFYPIQLRRFLGEYQPDIIQCEQPWSMFSTLLYARHFHIPCVLDEHNVEYLWSIHASKVPFLAPAIFAVEKTASLNSSLTLATSEVDKQFLIQKYNASERKIFVVPNGVDIKRFSIMPYAQSQLRKKLNLPSKKKTVLFHGIMSAKQNYEAAKLIMDVIAPKIVDATFLIIGKDPPPLLKIKAKQLHNVLLLGYVPNVDEYIMAADICIAPIRRGSGTRLKIMEYLAAGKPIVATLKAVEGIPVINGVHSLLQKEVDKSFVSAIKKLMTDDLFAETLGLNARSLCVRYDWSRVAERLFNKNSLLLDVA